MATPALWPFLEAQPGLLQHVLQWNADVLESMGKKLATVGADTAGTLGGSVCHGAGLGAGQYAAVEAVVEKADKRVQVMLSIARCHGRQVCHADTLVAACLMDDMGTLTSFVCPCRLGHDARFKPTFDADQHSSVAALLA